jgi:hypothetical protein
MPVQEGAGDRRISRVGDLGVDVRGAVGELGERGSAPSDGDDGSADLGKGGRDPAAEASGCADDDRVRSEKLVGVMVVSPWSW